MLRRSSTLTLLVLAGCATANPTTDRSTHLFSEAPAPRSTCRVHFSPSPLPGVAVLSDSAALATAVADFAQRFPVRDGRMRALFSLGYDAEGRVQRLRMLEWYLPQGQDAAFTEMVRRHLTPPAGSPASVRLHFQPGEESLVAVGYSEQCPPESRTSFRLFVPAGMELSRQQNLRVRLRVTEQGQVQNLTLLSGTGDDRIDRWVVQALERYQFNPGLIDGQPVAMDHEETVRVVSR